MASHALDQRLIEQTIDLTGNSSETSPADGVQLISGWLKVIEGNKSTELIEGKLKELQTLLQFSKPDIDRIRGLLLDLADDAEQVTQASDLQAPTINKLEHVIDALQKLASQL
ncbi:hypothetical protein WBJ53_06330 [Spirosoma sp. SC4-14]|uniref:hypothetical protein n=1 Tax=Spirosoma sp. SC4-14 TaxID=3128900 RepID=UPI0030D61F71